MKSLTSVRERFANAIVWNFIATLALQGGTFLTNLWVANILGAETFGKFGLVISGAQTVGALLQLSTGLAANKYVSQHRLNDPDFAAAVLGFCGRISYFAGALGTLALAAVAVYLPGTDHQFGPLGAQLAMASPIVFCSVLMGFLTGALAGLEGFARSAKILLPLMAVQVLSTAYATVHFGLNGALMAMAGNFIVRTVATTRLLRVEARRNGLDRPGPEKARLKQMFFSFMLPGALTGLTTMPALWFASATLAQTSDGFTRLGLFNAAFALRGILMIFPWIVSTVGFTFLNSHLKAEQARSFWGILWANLGLSLVAVVVGAGIVLLAGARFLSGYGAAFMAGTVVLQILMLSLLGEALALPLSQALISRGRILPLVLLIVVPRDLAIGALGAMFARSHGAEGLAWVHAAAWLVAMVACGALLLLDRTRSSTLSLKG